MDGRRGVFQPPARRWFVQASETFAEKAPPPPLDAALVRRADLASNLDLLGRDYRVAGPALGAVVPVLRGHFHTMQLRPGLVLHRTRVCDLYDMQTSVWLNPALKLTLVIDGATDMAFGTREFRFGPQRDGRGRLRHQATLLSLAEPDRFRRQWRRGRHESKVSLTLLPEWLEQEAVDDGPAVERLRAFRRCHLAVAQWEPSARAVGLAHQIVHAPPLTAPLARLYLESRAIELVAEALAVVAGAPVPEAPTLSTREHRRLRELCDLLDRGEADGWSLADIARHVGMSATTLQRAFRRFSGQTLSGYVRGRKLDHARDALERDGVSVAQAAALAGYTTAANFATAFRRRYGTTPRGLRARC